MLYLSALSTSWCRAESEEAVHAGVVVLKRTPNSQLRVDLFLFCCCCTGINSAVVYHSVRKCKDQVVLMLMSKRSQYLRP